MSRVDVSFKDAVAAGHGDRAAGTAHLHGERGDAQGSDRVQIPRRSRSTDSEAAR